MRIARGPDLPVTIVSTLVGCGSDDPSAYDLIVHRQIRGENTGAVGNRSCG